MSYVLDPELATVTPRVPAISLSDPTAARTLFKQAAALTPPYECRRELTLRDALVPGPSGAPELALRIYSPAQRSGLLPALLYLHGGAFVMGDLAAVHNGAQALADRVNVVVVSVDYRLAPEHPYPAGLNDGYAALEWVSKQAAELGVDPERIGVLGEGAGGGLAAGLALLTLARRGPRLIAQLLDAPTLDDRLQTHSMRTFTETPGWPGADSPLSWRYYLGEGSEPGSPDISLYAAPARAKAEDMFGLPQAWLALYALDPTRDEGFEYAYKLLEAGISTDVNVYASACHLAHAVAPKSTIGARILGDRCEAVRRLLLAPV
jgi:acetyl esterase